MREKILCELKQKREKYVSGGKLSSDLRISRTAIWKHINSLKKLGYEIEAKPKKGYRLVKSPDILMPEEIKIGLKTRFIGRNLRYFDSVSSTSIVAKQLAEEGSEEGTLVIAESQSMGKGRLGRSWASPEGGIWLSIILRPKISPSAVQLVSIAAGVAAANAIRKLGLDAKLKWPNDVTIGDKKVCGILTELAAEVEAVRYAVLGIGINANNDVEDLPLEVQTGATTLKKELGGPIARANFVQQLLQELEARYTLFQRDPVGILNEWRSLSATLGRKVQINTQGESFTGMARNISSNGCLIVELEDGSIKQVISGDCLSIRSG